MKKTFYTVGSLIILLICAFVFVLVPAMVGGGKQPETPTFGKYNGKSIRYEQDSDFANLVNQYGQYYQNMGYQIDNSTYFYIFNAAFNSTVAKMAAEDAVAKSGYTVPKSAVNRSMLPYFYDETGKYSSKLYKQTPEATINSMRKEISSSLVSSRFNDDHFGSSSEIVGSEALYGLKESDAELDFLSSVGTKKRGFNMALFEYSSFPDSEKVAFGKENIAKFEKYDMSVITVDSESEAKKVAKRLAAEEISFADAVAEYSTKMYSNPDGKLNVAYAYQIENIFEKDSDAEIIKGLSVGSTSEILKTKDGWSIFKTDAASASPDVTSEDFIYTVSNYISSYETSVIENYFLAKACDLKSDAALNGFASACAKAGIEAKEIPAFPMNYGSVAVAAGIDTSISGLATANENENFLKTVFTLKMNEVSEPLVMDGNVAVFQFTSEENADADAEAVLSELEEMDQTSASKKIMDSPKLENNFTTTYFNNFMN